MRKKGFYKETTYQLILIFITLVFLGILVGSIFSGLNLQNALCKAIPWLCGERQDVNYEISLKSTQNAICGVGSAFLKRQWDGGLDCNWGEPETGEPFAEGGGAGGGGSSGTADITAFAASDEEEIDITEARKLPSSVNCGKNDIGEYVCTVYNFIMPQEATDWEEWIAFWGDPHYLVYWSAFPEEEDTWNFEVKIWHHIVVGLIALVPPGKGAALGFKTISTIFKGPGKNLLTKEAAELAVREGSETAIKNAAFSAFARRKISAETKELIVDSALAAKAALEAGEEITKEEAELLIKKGFSKLPKKELKMFLEELGEKRGTAWALKELMKRDLMKMLFSRIEKVTTKKGLWSKVKAAGLQTVILGGKVAGEEAALYALADSMMEKYDPVGNAIAIKNPGNESEDLEEFRLPESMEGKPVMMSWRADSYELKHAHFASPCYIKEFQVKKVDEIKCDQYIHNRTGKETTCNNKKAEISGHDAPLICGRLEDNIGAVEDAWSGMYQKIKGFIEMNDKELFEIENSKDKEWELMKINIPWFLTGDKSPKYAITDIEFIPSSFHAIYPARTVTTKHPKIDDKLDFLDRRNVLYKNEYKAKIIEGSNNIGLTSINLGDKDEYLMEREKEYLLHMINIGEDDVVLDVYDISECTNLIDLSPYDYEQFSCEEVKTLKPDLTMNPVFPTVEEEKAEQIGRIKSTIEYLMYNGGEYTLKITDVADDIVVGDIDNAKAIRTFGNIIVDIRCDAKVSQPIKGLEQGRLQEECKIDSPELNKYFKSKIMFERHIMFKLNEGDTIYDITYPSIYFEPEDGVFVSFNDMDENEIWEEITLSVKTSFLDKINPLKWFSRNEDTKDSFVMSLSGIKDGDYEKIFMTNCKVDGVVISFEENSVIKNMIDVDGSNYCVRELTSTSRIVRKIGIWVGTALGVAAMFAGDGLTAPLLFGGAIGVAGGPLQAEYVKKWP